MQDSKIENGLADVETRFLYWTAKALQVGLEDLVGSDSSRTQLLEQIKNRLNACSEKDLVLVFEYLSNIVKN